MPNSKQMDPQEELVRLMVLQLRKSVSSQGELIVDLARVGFGQTRIAELIGTTQNAVNVTLNKAKKRAKKQPVTKQGHGDDEAA